MPKTTQYFSKHKLIWVDMPSNEDPLKGMKDASNPQFYVNKMLEYKYQIRTK